MKPILVLILGIVALVSFQGCESEHRVTTTTTTQQTTTVPATTETRTIRTY